MFDAFLVPQSLYPFILKASNLLRTHMEEPSGKLFRIFADMQMAESWVSGKIALISPLTLAMI